LITLAADRDRACRLASYQMFPLSTPETQTPHLVSRRNGARAETQTAESLSHAPRARHRSAEHAIGPRRWMPQPQPESSERKRSSHHAGWPRVNHSKPTCAPRHAHAAKRADPMPVRTHQSTAHSKKSQARVAKPRSAFRSLTAAYATSATSAASAASRRLTLPGNPIRAMFRPSACWRRASDRLRRFPTPGPPMAPCDKVQTQQRSYRTTDRRADRSSHPRR